MSTDAGESIRATEDGRRALTRSWFEDQEAVEALEPVLRMPRRSRYRVLTVVCEQQQHPLLTIYQTVAGPVYVGKASLEWKSDSVRFEPRTRNVVGRLDRQAWQQRAVPFDEVVASVGCRCRTADIPLQWVEAQLAEGRRRVVWAEPAKR